MKNILRYLGFTALVAVIGFLTTCDKLDDLDDIDVDINVNRGNNGNPGTPFVPITSTETDGPITSVNIIVIPPVIGTAPVNKAYGAGNYTIGEVSWTPAHNPFQDNTSYTVTVVLTADNDCTFTGLNSVIINEQNAVIKNNIGTVVILSYTFPPTDDTSINKFLANPYTANDRIKYSFLYDEYAFYYIYLGGMANIPIFTFPVKQHNGQPGNIYTVSMSNQTMATVEEAVTTHAEDAITTIEENSYSATTGGNLKVEVGAKASFFGIGGSAKTSAESYWQEYIANNTTLINQQKTSLTNTVSHAATYVYTTTISDSFDLGYRKAGYYRYSLFSVSDVYLYVIKNSRTNELVYYEFKEQIIPNAFFWALDYSETPSFTKSDATRFTLDIAVLDNLPRRFTINSTAQWNEALTIIKNNGNGTAGAPKTYELIVNGNVTVPGRHYDYAGQGPSFGSVQYVEVTLKGSGKLSLGSNGSILCIGDNQKLIVDSKDLTLQGRSGNNRSVLYAGSGGTLELKNGVISDNTIDNDKGGGVSVGEGTFTMSGGTISGNTAAAGGGVYTDSSCTFTMNNGTISGNTAISSNGGGVRSNTFIMNGGTISGNTSSGNGGGVSVSKFTMTGGTISGNIAYEGGGVRVYDNFTKTGGTITGYASDAVNGNVVRNINGAVQSDRGHAVYISYYHYERRKETTAGPGVNLSWSNDYGSPTWSGGWDY
jgi:hypothetical protein